MKTINKKAVMIVFFLLVSPLTFSFSNAEVLSISQNFQISSDDNQRALQIIDNNVTIRIAQYPKFGGGCDELVRIVFNYTWKINNITYRFISRVLTLEEVAGNGEKPLNVENYDLLYVGVNYWSYIRDGLNEKIQNNIKNFLSQGGGYIGSCAGVTFASQGFEKPKDVYQRCTNRGVLKIADVYMNQDWPGEMQYCMRSIGALPPVDLKVEKSAKVPIFDDYCRDHINMTYGGGPGLYIANSSDSKLGEIAPLLIFDEELMDTKPIHWYIKGILPGWIPIKKVKTDLKGYYAGVATTYNNSGRIVLFSTHAEILLVVNGTIIERFGKRPNYSSFGILPHIVYEWSGTFMNMSHNFWIHRRAAAWIAGVPDEDLPPCNELMVFMDKPQFRFGHQFYFKDSLIGRFFNFSLLESPFNFPRIEKSLILSRFIGKSVSKWLSYVASRTGMTVIVGDITVEAYAENSNIVEFYLDGELKNTSSTRDSNGVFRWKLDENNLKGIHRLEIRAYDEYGNCVRDGSEFFFINT